MKLQDKIITSLEALAVLCFASVGFSCALRGETTPAILCIVILCLYSSLMHEARENVKNIEKIVFLGSRAAEWRERYLSAAESRDRLINAICAKNSTS